MSNSIKLVKKDCLLLKDYGVKYILLIIIVSVCLSISTGAAGLYFIMPMMASRYLLSGAMNFEDKDNGYLGLCLLPLKRREIVLSKYILMVLLYLSGILLAAVTREIGVAAGFYGSGSFPYLAMAGLSFLFNTLSDCVRLPAVFKSSEVKARIYNMVTMVFMMVVIAIILTREVRELLFDTLGILNYPVVLALALTGLSFLILFISYTISAKIMEGKDL